MKRALAFVLIAVMALMAAGCGGGGEADGKVTLKIGMPSGADITPMEIADSFKAANPDITVELDEAPWNEFKKKLKVQLASNNVPDVFLTDSGYTATLGAMGAAEDLAPKIKADVNADEYASSLFAADDGNGHVWGIPHGLNAVGIYYNKKLFDEAGLPYPTEDWTFDEMFDMARKLTKDKDGDGEIDQYGLSYGTNVTEGWLPFVVAAGGAPLDETRTKSMFADAKTIEGFKKFTIPQQEGFAPTLDWSQAQGSGVAAFYENKLAMMLTLSSHINAIKSNAPADFDYDVEKLPIGWDGERHCVYIPNDWVIFSRTDDAKKDAAWKFILHFINDESQNIVASKLLSGFPIKKSALETIGGENVKPSNIAAFYEGVNEAGVTLFENGNYEEWRPMVDDWAAKMRQGMVSVEDALPQIDAKMQEILAQ